MQRIYKYDWIALALGIFGISAHVIVTMLNVN